MKKISLENLRNDFSWLEKNCNIEIFSKYRLNDFDFNKLNQKIENLSTEENQIRQFIDELFHKHHLQNIDWNDKIIESDLPAVALFEDGGFKIVIEKQVDHTWKTISRLGEEDIIKFPDSCKFKPIRLQRIEKKFSSAKEMFMKIARSQKKYLFYLFVATITINILALASSFYSMQVYDRVIPTNGLSTLFTLSIGVIIAIILELFLKVAKSIIGDYASKEMDIELSHNIFNRFLSLRIDSMPKGIGSLSGQLQSYNTVRNFISTASIFLLVDFPFSLMFLFVVIMLGGFKIGLVILIFAIISIILGIMFKKKIINLTKESSMASYKKLGLLVESIESISKIKANGAKWSLMGKWSALSEDSINDELKIKHYTDISTYLATFSQQISYIMIVATGAYLISSTADITMGSLIAITILSNKVFAPIVQIPNLFVQFGRAKISIDDLDNIFKLNIENDGIENPIIHKFKSYDLKIEDLKFEYKENRPILEIKNLDIKMGEKVAILGVVGSGKSTLLNLISGLYKPTTGHIYLDSIDMEHIARNSLSHSIGYLPQENRLFSGTLRDNLTFGLLNIDDETILDASKKTGLINLISILPEGLDTTVPEGGQSVSGGQKQLIALTRMIIANNNILLLDEPTASIDEGSEKHILKNLKEFFDKKQTVIIVTHKPSVISLVDRIIVLSNKGIVMDGEKSEVLDRLRGNK